VAVLRVDDLAVVDSEVVEAGRPRAELLAVGASEGDVIEPGAPRVEGDVTGLSSRTEVTTTSAVITSPGRTGARKRQSTCRKTLPGPGRSSATTALSRALVTPPWTTIPPNRLAPTSPWS
jgi:hypothetical protein